MFARFGPLFAMVALALPACKERPALRPARPAQLDSTRLSQLVEGMERLVSRAKAEGLLDLKDASGETVQKRDSLRSFFAAFLDHAVTLDGMRSALKEQRGNRRFDSEIFLLTYALDLALYVNSAELLSAATGERNYEKILDEASPRFGIQKGDFRRLKTAFNFNPVEHPLALAHALHETLGSRYQARKIGERHPWALAYIDRRSQDMFRTGLAKSPKILAKEWKDLAKSGFDRIWFPGQRGVATWLGDTKVRDKDKSLISREQIHRLQGQLRPGDVLVERRNWYLSNVGLPGFWTHAALYLGTPAELGKELGEPGLASLESAHPKAFALWSGNDDGNHPHRLIEAVSEGVIFTSLEHSADADYVGVMRPNVDRQSLLRAIGRAFEYHGRPYDFDFDFLSDASLVCTELVYKAYEGVADNLRFPLVEVLGRPTLPANELVRFFDEHADEERAPLSFVTFLDGRVAEGRAVEAELAAFRTSYLRPRWDLVQP